MNATATPTPESLRAAMVDRVKAAGWPQEPSVERAMRTVPRHLFVPNAPLTDAYAAQAVITKTAADGAALSCASEPQIVAMMLDQLRVEPGQRILEIGAGTGYNAALLAELTGPTGEVTTVDIDPEVTTAARHALDRTGYGHVHVATCDGALGDPDHAPYDRIIVTVGAWDIPPAWWTQLRTGGRLVLPLRWRGQTRSLAFTHHAHHMTSDSVELCGFVPMIGQPGEHIAYLDHDHHVSIHYDADQPVDPTSLSGILDQPPTTQWSKATVGGEEPFDGIWLRLTATQPGTCRITADPTAIETGLCTPAIPVRSPAIIENGSLAYLTIRRAAGTPGRWDLGAAAHGPDARDLAERLCAVIDTWSESRTTQPAILAYRTGDLDTGEQRYTVLKELTAITITY